jgi:hypothetical protein
MFSVLQFFVFVFISLSLSLPGVLLFEVYDRHTHELNTETPFLAIHGEVKDCELEGSWSVSVWDLAEYHRAECMGRVVASASAAIMW